MYEFNQADIFRFADIVGAETRRNKKRPNELEFKLCPYCKGGQHVDKWKFSINLTNGAFNCVRGSCGKKGNLFVLSQNFPRFTLDTKEKPVDNYKKFAKKEIQTTETSRGYLERRGISLEVVERYKVTSRVKKGRTEIVFPLIDAVGEVQGIKYRPIGKDYDGPKEYAEDGCRPYLFGVHQCKDFERLIITEGQIDALTVATCGFDNAVAVAMGKNDSKWITELFDWVKKFKEIVVFGDCENGKVTLFDAIQNSFGSLSTVRCVRVEDFFGEKDANDLYNICGKDYVIKAIENATMPMNKYLIDAADVVDVNIDELQKIKTNIEQLDEVCGGLLFGNLTLLSGQRGEGKSTFASQLICETLIQGYPVFAYSGELPNYMFKNWLNLQMCGTELIESYQGKDGRTYYRPQEAMLPELNEFYRNKLIMFNNSTVRDNSFKGILEITKEAISKYNIKLVVIDNLMTAMDDDVSNDLYRQQSKFVKNLQELSQQRNVAILLIAHPRKTASGYSKDDSANCDAISGSSDITNATTNVWYYRRAEENDECDGKLYVIKNRMNGRLLEGDKAIKLMYDHESRRVGNDKDFKKKVYKFFDEHSTSEKVKNVTEGLPF